MRFRSITVSCVTITCIIERQCTPRWKACQCDEDVQVLVTNYWERIPRPPNHPLNYPLRGCAGARLLSILTARLEQPELERNRNDKYSPTLGLEHHGRFFARFRGWRFGLVLLQTTR